MPSAAVVIQRQSNENKHGSYTCRDCDQTFPSAQEYSDHFIRREGTIQIIGCRTPGPATGDRFHKL